MAVHSSCSVVQTVLVTVRACRQFPLDKRVGRRYTEHAKMIKAKQVITYAA